MYQNNQNIKRKHLKMNQKILFFLKNLMNFNAMFFVENATFDPIKSDKKAQSHIASGKLIFEQAIRVGDQFETATVLFSENLQIPYNKNLLHL